MHDIYVSLLLFFCRSVALIISFRTNQTPMIKKKERQLNWINGKAVYFLRTKTRYT